MRKGHCKKSEYILDYFGAKSDFDWLVIADDDTAMHVPVLLDVLALYDPSVPTVLGERYGYGLAEPYGYSYITGGGGMVFSRAAVAAISVSTQRVCVLSF